MALCLVTGGAGFLGSHVAAALAARGDEVRVLDDFSTGSLANFARLGHRIEVYSGNVCDRALLERATLGVEYLFHFAAPAAETDCLQEGEACAGDTLALLSAAQAAGVRRVIYASSGRIYGTRGTVPVKETDATLPLSRSGLAKLIGEHHCAVFTDRYGMETVRLRFFNVFGRCQSPHTPYARALATLIDAVREGREWVHVNAVGIQDYLHVDDAVYGTLLAAGHSRAAGRVYNIARGRSVELTEVAGILNELLGQRTRLMVSDTVEPPLIPGRVDIGRAEAELGFCPATDLKRDLVRHLGLRTHTGFGGVDVAPTVVASLEPWPSLNKTNPRRVPL